MIKRKDLNWWIRAVIFLIGICYLITAIFSLPISNDSKTNALQTYHVVEEALPIFYPGQAWMGTAGIYLLTLVYELDVKLISAPPSLNDSSNTHLLRS